MRRLDDDHKNGILNAKNLSTNKSIQKYFDGMHGNILYWMLNRIDCNKAIKTQINNKFVCALNETFPSLVAQVVLSSIRTLKSIQDE